MVGDLETFLKELDLTEVVRWVSTLALQMAHHIRAGHSSNTCSF